MRRAQHPGVVAIGTLPPPVTGMTLVTDRVLTALERSTRVMRVTPGSHVNSGFWWRVYRQAALLAATLVLPYARARGYSVLYAPADSKFGLVRLVVQVVIARLFGFRVVVHHHASSYLTRPSRLLRLATKLHRDATRHVVLCQVMRQSLVGSYAVSSTVVVPNFLVEEGLVHIGRTRSAREFTDDLKPVFGFISNVTMAKGVGVLRQVIDRLVDEGRGAPLLIAGPCVEPEARQELDSITRTRGGEMKYLGSVYGDEKLAFFRDIDVLVFPTLYESEADPVVVHEALAAGVPVLAFDRACIRERVGDAGWIADSIDDLHRLWRGLVDDPRSITEAARRCSDRRSEASEWESLVAEAVLG